MRPREKKGGRRTSLIFITMHALRIVDHDSRWDVDVERREVSAFQDFLYLQEKEGTSSRLKPDVSVIEAGLAIMGRARFSIGKNPNTVPRREGEIKCGKKRLE